MEGFKGRPKALMCYICGREFGTKSLQIHIKSCLQKWENEENKKPKKDRRPPPQPPKAIGQVTGKGNLDWNEIEKYNDKANEKFVNESMVRCPNCQRTFLEDRFVVHARVCTKDKPMKGVNPPKNTLAVEETNIRSKSNTDYPKFDEEEVCGRNFAKDRIAKHQQICVKSKKNDEKREKKIEMKMAKIEKKRMSLDFKDKKNQKGAEPKWKKQHNELIESLKYMRQVKKVEDEGGDVRMIKPPPTFEDNSLVPCPFCGRKFAEQTAERHIPKCKDIINKPKPPPSKTNALTMKNPAPKNVTPSKNVSDKKNPISVTGKNMNMKQSPKKK